MVAGGIAGQLTGHIKQRNGCQVLLHTKCKKCVVIIVFVRFPLWKACIWRSLTLVIFWSFQFFFFYPALQVGTSSVVYPAAMFAPQVAARGVPVAEFNMENTPTTMHFKCVSDHIRHIVAIHLPARYVCDVCSVNVNSRFRFHFHGPCGSTLPPALARHETEQS